MHDGLDHDIELPEVDEDSIVMGLSQETSMALFDSMSLIQKQFQEMAGSDRMSVNIAMGLSSGVSITLVLSVLRGGSLMASL